MAPLGSIELEYLQFTLDSFGVIQTVVYLIWEACLPRKLPLPPRDSLLILPGHSDSSWERSLPEGQGGDKVTGLRAEPLVSRAATGVLCGGEECGLWSLVDLGSNPGAATRVLCYLR